MIHPRIDELLENVDSRYALVIVAAKRARQINNYHHQLGEGTFDDVPAAALESRSKNYLTMAMEEIAEGMITYDYQRSSLRNAPALRSGEDVLRRADAGRAGVLLVFWAVEVVARPVGAAPSPSALDPTSGMVGCAGAGIIRCMARVLLGVSGGIAAYKACDLARLFVKAGHEVIPLVTPGAERFVDRGDLPRRSHDGRQETTSTST